ncbi:hypothetical protein [Agrobacterium sp. LMR679]|uniref:hypothetical protein n=1 Tax=Agrobacterium sp. LMR679 TaxID=3014335 RepID=UPI0022AEFC02|nr:hypothetical protein [Agrobacterium sp. LMR679]MCZ4072799.1 hypothetical protein [Agrobacterium sp. LMR679]
MTLTDTSTLEKTTTRKVFWRIVPYCFILYVISYLDRANLGYAALEMNKDLALSAEAFGFAGESSSSAISCSRFRATSRSRNTVRASGFRVFCSPGVRLRS